MNSVSVLSIKKTRELFAELKYKLDETSAEDKVVLSATNKQTTFYIDYSEAGDRHGYSLYDLDLIANIDDESFVKIYSERLEDNINQDFEQVRSIIKAINQGGIEKIYERSLFFWKRCYLKVEVSSTESILMLRTRST